MNKLSFKTRVTIAIILAIITFTILAFIMFDPFKVFNSIIGITFIVLISIHKYYDNTTK